MQPLTAHHGDFGYGDEHEDHRAQDKIPCDVCFRERDACTTFRRWGCQLERGKTFSNFTFSVFLLNAIFMVGPALSMALGFLRVLQNSSLTEAGGTWFAVTDIVRGACNLVLLLLLLNAWVQVTPYQTIVLAFQFGSVIVENYLALVLFLEFVVLGMVYLCDVVGFVPYHPSTSCSSSGINFMVVLYLLAAVLSWMELLVMEGAPPPPEGH